VRRTDGLQHERVVVQTFQQLIEIARPHTAAQDHAAGIRLATAQDTTEQSRLARPVRPQDPPLFAAQNIEAQVRKQRLIVGFGQVFDAEYDVAGPRRFGKRHPRRGDLARRLDALDPLQLLAAVLGLGVFLPVMVPPHEILHLGDFRLLFLVGPPLDFQPLRLLPLVGCVVARVGVHGAAEQLQRPVRDLVQEIAVVADQDQRLAEINQVALQPFRRFDVQVVRRLVQQQQVRFLEQQLGQQQPVLLAAAELFHVLAIRLRREVQSGQHALDLMIEVVGVAVVQFVLQVVETFAQAAAFDFVLGLSQRGGQTFRVAGQGNQVAKRVVRFVPDRMPGRELRLLFQVSDPRRPGQFDRPRVRLLASRQDPEDRRLARPIRPDQRDPLPRAHVERDPIQDRIGPITLVQIADRQQHSNSSSRVAIVATIVRAWEGMASAWNRPRVRR